MSVESITLQVPEALLRSLAKPIAQQAKQLATQTQQPVEEILLEWLTHSFTELPVESLPDSQILALCDLQLDEQQQETLSGLLERQRESRISSGEKTELDFLMRLYRSGLVRKAKALKVALDRGLRPPLSATA